MASGDIHRTWYKRTFFPLVLPSALAVTGILVYFGIKINPFLFLLFALVNYWLAGFIDPDADHIVVTNAESRSMNSGKKISRLLTFFGWLMVAYWFMYAWFVSLFGGHRSWVSHSLVIGTIGRIIYFNIPLLIGLIVLYRYGIVNWGWFDFVYHLYLDIWAAPYLFSQLVVWSVTDAVHLFMDTDVAKGLYKNK